MSRGRKTVEQKLARAQRKIESLVMEVREKERSIATWMEIAKTYDNQKTSLERTMVFYQDVTRALVIHINATKDNPFRITEQELMRLSRETEVMVERRGKLYKFYVEGNANESSVSAKASISPREEENQQNSSLGAVRTRS